MIKLDIPKINTELQVFNETNKDVAEIYLYGSIMKHSWYNEDSVTSKKVRDMLENIEANTIKVHINSGGGDVFESIAISNLLKESKKTIEIYVDALAGSGASIVTMAGDKRIMYSNAMMMIHQASTCIYGNADQLRKAATDLDKIDSAVTASYKDKFIGNEEELTSLLKVGTWLTAKECLALGFCTEIVEEPKEDEPEEKETDANVKETILNKYMGNQITNTKEANLLNNNNNENKLNKQDLYKAFTGSFKL